MVPWLEGKVIVPRLFHCTVAGLVIATGLSFLFGASGLSSYRDLRAYEAHVSDGIAALQDRHRRLQQRAAVLRDNPEALRLLARETGYFRRGETVIEVGPVSVDPTAAAGPRPDREFANVAPLLHHPPPAPREPFNALALGLFLGVGTFTVLSTLRAFGRRRAAGQPERAPGRGAPPSGAGVTDPIPPEPAPKPMPEPRAAAAGTAAERRDRATPAQPAAEPEAETEPPGRRRKPRRPPRDVTVYRL